MKSYQLYKQTLKHNARELRKNSTLSEVLLWEKLKGRQLFGFKFRRQTPIGKYIVDFYCKELKLAIEIDGFSHDFKIGYDMKREKELLQLGVNMVHFSDLEIKKDIHNVIQRVVEKIDANPPLPRPSGD